MSNQINELEKHLSTSKARYDELNVWLKRHTTHPDFIKIAGDRNNIGVVISGLERQIKNLKSGKPSHGDAIEAAAFVTTQYQSGTLKF